MQPARRARVHANEGIFLVSEHSPVPVLAAGVASLVLTLGIGRFAYTPLLPVMQSQAGLSAAQAGWLAALNYAGYLCGALLAIFVGDLALKDRLYRIGLVLAVLATGGMALSDSLVLWGAMRFLAGLGSAAGLLIGSGLILNWLIRHNHRSELGFHFSGVGLGIVVSALATDAVAGVLGWRGQWLALAALGCLLIPPAWGWLPRPGRFPVAAGEALIDKKPPTAWLMLLLGAYFCAGYGYVVFGTFIVLIAENRPELRGSGGLVWLVVGVAATLSPLLWDRLARRLGTLRALRAAYVLQAVGIALPVMDAGVARVLGGAVLYGATFMGIVGLTLTMVGRLYPNTPSRLMGLLTLSFGLAQITGPVVTGVMAEFSGSFDGPLVLAAGVMLLGMALLALLRERAGEGRGAEKAPGFS